MPTTGPESNQVGIRLNSHLPRGSWAKASVHPPGIAAWFRPLSCARCGLIPGPSGAPTAGHQARGWCSAVCESSKVDIFVCRVAAGPYLDLFGDDYSGFKTLFALSVAEAGCMAHPRRNFSICT